VSRDDRRGYDARAMATGVRRHIPNSLTLARLALACVFFGMLANWPHGAADFPKLYLNLATLIYVVATLTDYLDGYLARRWDATSAFGRVVDPFVDKILVLGSFAYFAGPSFVEQRPDGRPFTLTGVTPSVVVVLLGREFLVTMLRSVAEGGGKSYGAAWSGKVKMVLQCVTIFVILAYVNYQPQLVEAGVERAARLLRDVCVWGTVVVTVVSGAMYLRRSLDIAREPAAPSPGAPLAPGLPGGISAIGKSLARDGAFPGQARG